MFSELSLSIKDVKNHDNVVLMTNYFLLIKH